MFHCVSVDVTSVSIERVNSRVSGAVARLSRRAWVVLINGYPTLSPP